MIEFYASIYDRLKTVLNRVYYERIKEPDKVIYPYATFSLASSTDQNNRITFILEVDIWDDDQDTSNLETLTWETKKAIDHYVFNDLDISYHAYVLNILNIPETDENLRRRQLRFEFKTYIRS